MSIQFAPDQGSTTAVCYPASVLPQDVLVWFVPRRYRGRHKMRARRIADALYSSYSWTLSTSGQWVPVYYNWRRA